MGLVGEVAEAGEKAVSELPDVVRGLWHVSKTVGTVAFQGVVVGVETAAHIANRNHDDEYRLEDPHSHKVVYLDPRQLGE